MSDIMAAKKIAISIPSAVPLDNTSLFRSFPSWIMISVPRLRMIKESRRSLEIETSVSVGSRVPITALKVLSKVFCLTPEMFNVDSISGYAKR